MQNHFIALADRKQSGVGGGAVLDKLNMVLHMPEEIVLKCTKIEIRSKVHKFVLDVSHLSLF